MSRRYCKAYYLKDLQQFGGWNEERYNGKTEFADDTIVYLWDDFTVVQSPILPDSLVLWDQKTPAWLEFCQGVLHFAVPEDLQFAYQEFEDGLPASDETEAAEESDSAPV